MNEEQQAIQITPYTMKQIGGGRFKDPKGNVFPSFQEHQVEMLQSGYVPVGMSSGVWNGQPVMCVMWVFDDGQDEEIIGGPVAVEEGGNNDEPENEESETDLAAG